MLLVYIKELTKTQCRWKKKSQFNSLNSSWLSFFFFFKYFQRLYKMAHSSFVTCFSKGGQVSNDQPSGCEVTLDQNAMPTSIQHFYKQLCLWFNKIKVKSACQHTNELVLTDLPSFHALLAHQHFWLKHCQSVAEKKEVKVLQTKVLVSSKLHSVSCEKPKIILFCTHCCAKLTPTLFTVINKSLAFWIWWFCTLCICSACWILNNITFYHPNKICYRWNSGVILNLDQRKKKTMCGFTLGLISSLKTGYSF